MKYQRLHSWQVSPQEAVRIQNRLREKIILKTRMPRVSKLAACDVGFTERVGKVIASVAVFSFPQLELIEKVVKSGRVNFPYVPGLLTFREGPILLKAFSAVSERPDVVLFDGQGIAHPRRMGLATHLGILLDIPTIGCAKSRLYGQVAPAPNFKGAYSYIRDAKGAVIGAGVRTRKDVRCVFVSAGYKVSLKTAIKIVLACSSRFRIPEPLRIAHRLSKSRLR